MTAGSVRGAHVLEGVVRVLARQGLSALSVRSVADAAGVSAAQVQYYFRTRAELITAAFERTSEEFLATLATIPATEVSLERLRQIIWRWLPVDSDREDRARVWVAYAAVAATDPNFAVASARLDADLRTWFTHEFEALARAGEVTPTEAAEVRAAQLLALIDGVTIQALTIPLDQRHTLATRTIDSWLDHLVPGS